FFMIHDSTIHLLYSLSLLDALPIFHLNPFIDGGEDQLGLVLNFRNVLFFNRGKQRYSSSYTFLSTSSDNLLATGLQRNDLNSHQDRKSTRLNSSHVKISYAVFCLKK